MSEIRQMIQRRKLTGLEWFGLISGVIGLVADLITLSSLAVIARHPNGLGAGVSILTFLLIIYTTAISGFYSRRLFCAKYKRRSEKLTQKQHDRISRGGTAVTLTIGTSLLYAFSLGVALATGDNTGFAMVFAILMGLPVCPFVAYLIDVGADAAYAAFDPYYSEPEPELPTLSSYRSPSPPPSS